MTLQGQLAQSATAQVPFPLDEYASFTRGIDRGLLANVSVQIISISSDRLTETHETKFRNAYALTKLAALKRQKFTIEGRHARIAASLAALNARQPTDLPLQSWKAILEE